MTENVRLYRILNLEVQLATVRKKSDLELILKRSDFELMSSKNAATNVFIALENK